jgi:ubiquinone/menaquinone biosynthesis C-methylase UbiE
MNHVDRHWDEQARKHGSGYRASWEDIFAIGIEVDLVRQYISPGVKVLDVGCGNGFSAESHALCEGAKIIGVDFSQAMVDVATSTRSRDGLSFVQGDIRNLIFKDDQFDIVYTTRTLINLQTWEEQQRGMEECIRVCRPGGTVLFLEAFWEPLVVLNAMRQLFALPPLVEHDFNRYLKKTKVDAFLKGTGHPFKNEDYSCIYYIGTRLLRDLLVDESSYRDYGNAFNALFKDIEIKHSARGCGIQQAYIVSKMGVQYA